MQEHTVRLWGGRIVFSGKHWSSVGYEYRLEYADDAFAMERCLDYKHPEMVEAGLCGGDEATLTYVLTPLKRGTFVIREQRFFRGDLEQEICHRYTVI